MRRHLRNRGFTLVEMLTVITIIGLLAAITLPAVFQAKKNVNARICQKNLQELARGCTMYEQLRGHYPGSRTRIAKANGPDVGATWLVSILPYIDQAPVGERWRDPNEAFLLAPNSYNAELAIAVSTFRCPQDTTLDAMILDLPVQGPTGYAKVMPETSYVASGGFVSMPGFDPGRYGQPGYLIEAMNRNNGIFHDLWRHPTAKVSLDMLHDGASNTVLLSENLQANYWFFNGDLSEDGTDTSQRHRNRFATMFYFPYVSDHPLVNNPNGAPTQSIRTAMRINGDKDSPPMASDPGVFKARPSSNHGGYVNMAFADGSVRIVAEDIDYHAYTSLITPRGSKADVPYRR